MLNRKRLVVGLLILGIALAFGWFYFHSHIRDWQSAREDLLSHLPADSTSVVYVDFQELRASAFLSQILAWAPRPQTEEEYEKFVQATGFDYERDLDRVGVSFSGSAQSPKTMAVAQGRFDPTNSCEGVRRIVSGLGANMSRRIETRCYEGGHMMYRDEPERIRLSDDLTKFITTASAPASAAPTPEPHAREPAPK